MRDNIRNEKEIFEDLEKLCGSDGFAHIIAYFLFRDSAASFSKKGINHLNDKHPVNRLVRSEIHILIGLMVKQDINLSLPLPDIFQRYIEKTEELLQELHLSMMPPIQESMAEAILDEAPNPFSMGLLLREGIFYACESAYSFQYRDMSIKKYAKDKSWFSLNKGFSIEEVKTVINAIVNFQNIELQRVLRRLPNEDIDKWTALPIFIFSAENIAEETGLDADIVTKVINAFTFPADSYNEGFLAVDDFNITNANPIIRVQDSTYLLFHSYTLFQALYETPFFWFRDDSSYSDTAMQNRGDFVEEFSAERLELVFGKDKVFKNVDIKDSKNNQMGEIDVLVLYADRAIVLQAKSKKLTLAARKGNDNLLNKDFEKAIQESYEQGFKCANFLNERRCNFYANGKKIKIPSNLEEIYIFCVVSDHYPSLCFQAQQFLKYQETSKIMAPFIMDLFLLDVMTEMLQSPLYFLSYINRRIGYTGKIITQHELLVFFHHLKNNLWISDENTFMFLADHECLELQEALMVRRENYQGRDTPEGILTAFRDTPFNKVIKQIELLEHPEAINLGFLLLKCSDDFIRKFNKGISKLIKLGKKDNKRHDISLLLDEGKNGVTIHLNTEPYLISKELLNSHCQRRKYIVQANSWFGLCIHPASLKIRLALCLNYQWQYSDEMEKKVNSLIVQQQYSTGDRSKSKKKIGRNDPCLCGSGKKYKKCCLYNP